jgi:hypothetical protein
VPAKKTRKEQVMKNKRFMTTVENLALWRMLFQENTYAPDGADSPSLVEGGNPAAVHDRPGSETA